MDEENIAAHYADSKRKRGEIHTVTRILSGNIVLSAKKRKGTEKGLHHIIYVNLKTHTGKHTTAKYFKDLVFQKPQPRRTNRINRQILKLK